VSQVLEGLLRGLRAEQPDASGGEWGIVRHAILSEQRLDNGCAESVGRLLEFVGRVTRALSGEDRDLLSLVQNVSGLPQLRRIRQSRAARIFVRSMVRHVALGSFALLYFHLLYIDREADVRHGAIGERGAAGEVRQVLDVRRSHHALVILRDVHKSLVEFDVLLRESSDQVVKLHSGDGEHRSAVELGVI
jgi:hypothetical protein